jgi:hypothetical protein
MPLWNTKIADLKLLADGLLLREAFAEIVASA